MNNFSNSIKVFNRLKREFQEHDSLVIAFDFDNTVSDFHNQGLDMSNTVKELKRAHANGLSLFCFTANNDHGFVKSFVESLLGIKNIPINNNCLDHIFNSRKPFYSLLLDDRAGLASAEEALWALNNYLETL
jgi:hypothetical protein